MKRSISHYIDLQRLILALVVLTMLATLANSLIVAYRVQRDALIHATLEANRTYAAKVAASIDEFIRSSHSYLGYSAGILANGFDDAQLRRREAVRLQAQDADFNSIAIIDTRGRVLEAYPDEVQIVGTTLRSDAIQNAIRARKPTVSPAYTSVAGNLVVFISQPVFSPEGQLLGVVGGSVYLRKQSVLHAIIGSHFHHDGTFAFVADRQRQLLHHPDPARVGGVMGMSLTLDAALRGESGTLQVRNSRGVPMLAGFAPASETGWAVVAQQPREQALAPLAQLMRDMTVRMIPASAFGLLLMAFGVRRITRPLNELALAANQLTAAQTSGRLQRIDAWYREAFAIRQALITSSQLLLLKLGQLTLAAHRDPMTGLANQHTLDDTLETLSRTAREYSLLAIDIDHFKRVNDTYGHAVGDLTIRHVAEILQHCSRSEDLCARIGGEEFILVLPDTPLTSARRIAERILAMIQCSEMPGAGRITVSIGIACRSACPSSPAALLQAADEQLYRAKRNGRNRVLSADDEV